MKSTALKRSGWLSRGKWKPMKRSELRKVNPARLAKRQAKLKAWHGSAEWRRQRKESLARAGHRCEYFLPEPGLFPVRCPETTRLHVHERFYRFEKSTLADRQVLCSSHHALIEHRDHPTRRHGR